MWINPNPKQGVTGSLWIEYIIRVEPLRSLKDNETDNIILEYAKKASEIIISWGTLNTLVLKERETEVLKLLKSAKKKVLAVSDNNGRTNLHILTPCVRSGFVLNEVNLKEILTEGLKKTEKTEKTETA